MLVDPRCKALLWALGVAALGCDSFSNGPLSEGGFEPPSGSSEGSAGGAPGFTPSAPTDERPAVSAAEAPPPVTGGTLLATADGKGAVIADPDRERISFVDLERMVVTGTVELARGDMPGRLVEDADGRIHAVLRGRGSVLTLDRATSSSVQSRDVCLAPRGIAYDGAADRLLVACAEGALVELSPAGAITKTVKLAADLRDVVVAPNRIAVSRFRSAELIELDANLDVVQTRKLPVVQNVIRSSDFEVVDFEPAVAWRTVAASDGSFFMAHQRATSATIDLGRPNDGVSSAYGGGNGDPCGGGIVQSGFTRVSSTGIVATTPQLGSAVLPVDIAVSPSRDWVAVAVAGPHDPLAPASSGPILKEGTEFPADALPALLLLDPNMANSAAPEPCAAIAPMGTEPTVAVAANPQSGDLLVQLREPSQLIVMTSPSTGGGTLARIPLGNEASPETESRYDTGHELFHRAAGAALACASCHPEGTEDGRVWNFSGMGARRTQYLRSGLSGTAPFHWDGTLQDLGALMEDVMVGRMGGARQTLERSDALGKWLFSMPLETPLGAELAAVERGKALFDTTAGCAVCHSGPKFTNNATVDVGTGGPLQVPSLVGIGLHPPYMHTGCAATLFDRFDPACGGKLHGETAGLSSAQINDLVAYLQSI